MGMFDDIRCEYRLPLPEDQGELAGRDWSKQKFQTKDLGQGMGVYYIRADGTLWLVEGRWLVDDPVGETFQKDFFGTVEFYDTAYGQKHDYRVQWAAVFAQGKVNDLRLSQWRLEDNSERLRTEAEMKYKAARTDRFLKTWVGRYLYPPYAWLVGVILRQIVAGGAYKLSKALMKVQTGAWQLEHRILPHGNPISKRVLLRRMKDRL